MNKKINLLLIALTTLTACSSDMPVLMTINNTKNLHGETTTTDFADKGDFDVENADKLACKGKYKPSERALLIMNINCSDDRFGRAVIFRDPDGENGRGSGTLSDGSKFSLIFGEAAQDSY